MSKRVDAAVLDMDHNRNEVTVIAQEIKRLRPKLPTIVLTEGPVAMDWQLDAAVLDMDNNRNEVTVIAQEIKRLRPKLPTIVLTEGPVAMDWQLADALVPKESGPETLVKSLKKLLAADRGGSAVGIRDRKSTRLNS